MTMEDFNRIQEALRGPVALCHLFLRERIGAGDRVVDATCGNGHDTRYLAGLVGLHGRIWSFDIDQGALNSAMERLREDRLENVVKFIHAGHEHMGEYVDEPVQAVVFNLGYLPGSARKRATCPETTVAALEQALRLLYPGGVILMVVYTGHPGGAEEAHAVNSRLSALSSPEFNVWSSRLLNRQENAPYLLLVEKASVS